MEPPKIPITNVKPKFTPQAPKPLVDLQVYQSQPAKPQTVQNVVNPAHYVPMSLPVGGAYYPPQFNPYWPMYNPMLQPKMVAPIVKQYSINNAPFLESVNLKVGGIREDVLPKQLTNTSNTLGERLSIHSFVRSVFIKTYDGEDVDLDGQGSNSILRYLKFLELNPYSPETTSNPYENMPTDMLLYKSCYPIKYEENTNSLQCSPNSLGMHVRVYTLTFGEYNVKRINGHNFYEYDIWRELTVYEHLREHVLKKKLCPNFVMLHAYYISEKCNIDRNKVLLLKGKSSKIYTPYILYLTKQLNVFIEQIKRMVAHVNANVPPFVALTDIQYFEKEIFALQKRYAELRNLQIALAEQQQLQKTEQLFTNINNDLTELKNAFKTHPPTTSPSTSTGIVKDSSIMGPQLASEPNIHSILSPNLYTFSGKGLVALTEAPTYSLMDWASIKYEQTGNIQKMINSGFHVAEVWTSVLFQIMVALHVLQKEKISFRNFSIGDNIYIKNITVHNNIKTYWKYMIGAYEYYVPNYGYLVLIDSNYKDVENAITTLVPTSETNNYKISSSIFGEKKYEDQKELDALKNDCFSAFTNTFSTNNFSKSFSNFGGSAIPEEIKDLIGKIATDVSRTGGNDIEYYIQSNMRSLMNNRVGTLVTELELKFINRADTTTFKEGQMLVHEIAHETYKFVIYVNETNAAGLHEVLTKDINNKIINDSNIHKSALFHYSKDERITQNARANEIQFNEDNLLETYRC